MVANKTKLATNNSISLSGSFDTLELECSSATQPFSE